MPSRQHVWRKRPNASELQPGSAFDLECRETDSKALPGTFHKVLQTAARGRGSPSEDGATGTWELVEGEDLLNEKVLEQHRLCLQIGLLGQGTPEGYVDHEFPPQAKSIDGLEGPPVKKGQAALIDLIASSSQRLVEDDDEEPPPPDAPRCQCGRRSRLNRVRVAGIVRGRPYFRCAGRACRFLSFGDFGSSSQAQALAWVRFRTGKSVNKRHIVVGSEGYRPEDARFGPEADSFGSCFVDALAVLAERPHLIARMLPNTLPGDEGASGCHEVRLCVDGNWQAVLIDERLPTSPAESELTGLGAAAGSRGAAITAAGKNRGEELAFSRNAGNQIWLPLLEKAYAKAFGAYHFALPGVRIDELLTDLTGAPVETLHISADRDAEPLWGRLTELATRGVLTVCAARETVGRPCPPAHALLGIAETGDPDLVMVGLGASRAVRLRSPRGGLHASSSTSEALAMLRGIPADGSKVTDGSFWVQFPRDFVLAFGQLYVCHAAAAGGNLAHTRSFEGEFNPDQGLGVRGCALRIATHEASSAVDCWLTLVQPTPRGARMLRPSMGRVFNDLGIIVLNAQSRTPYAVALGGAWRDVSCRIVVEPGQEYLAIPLSLRAWPGAVSLRVHAGDAVQVRRIAADHFARDAWDAMLRAASVPALMPTVQGGLRGVRRMVYPLPVAGAGPRVLHGAEVILVELEGAALLIVCNPHRTCAVLVKCELQASHMAVHTSRGLQFGEFLRERNEESRVWASSSGLDSQSDWRQYTAEDIVPPASVQNFCVLLAVSRQGWELELRSKEGMAMPVDMAGSRPASHAFAPHSFAQAEIADEVARETLDNDDDALNLAIQLSLADAEPNVDMVSKEKTARSGRWARHCRQAEGAKPPHPDANTGSDAPHPDANTGSNRRQRRHAGAVQQIFCEICTEAGRIPAALSCCSSRVCEACLRHWATVQISELCNPELSCPACRRLLREDELPLLLEPQLLQLMQKHVRERVAARSKKPPSETALGLSAGELARLDVKRCPACGTGTQKDVESCHKMICRSCRAKFCFRCLSRLEYFNCGCSGAEHRFVDPVDGRIIEHQ